MKQVIDGKLYDTEKAELIAEYGNGRGASDFRHCNEDLYRTPKGAYFIAGSGGPLSRWARPVGDMTGGGSGIIPMTKAEALAWCEGHDVDAETIAAEFADAVEEA